VHYREKKTEKRGFRRVCRKPLDCYLLKKVSIADSDSAVGIGFLSITFIAMNSWRERVKTHTGKTGRIRNACTKRTKISLKNGMIILKIVE